MIVTDDFVLINFPKTGSDFSRLVIKEIYMQRLTSRTLVQKTLQKIGLQPRPFLRELILPNIRISSFNWFLTQHGTYIQIPQEFNNRPIVSIIRNPYSRFMSLYDFKAWTKPPWTTHPAIAPELIWDKFPNFPEITVDEFISLGELIKIHGRFKGKKPNATVGSQSVQFIQFFFKEPERVLNELTDDYINHGDFSADMADVTFLRQENLNDELATFLLQHGYSEAEASYVRSRDRVNVTEGRSPNRDALWTPKALEYIRRNERLIFRILDAKGIHYDPPDNTLRQSKERLQ